MQYCSLIHVLTVVAPLMCMIEVLKSELKSRRKKDAQSRLLYACFHFLFNLAADKT